MADWFKNWFDSPYYHILYHNRDEREADLFVSQLLNQISFNPGSRVLDAGCGKGRYAAAMAERGLCVTGIDLSVNSINEALKMSSDQLHFYVHDFRYPFRINYFDAVFNLFTSFGYFDNQVDEMKCLNSFSSGLRKGGILLMDYLNCSKVIPKLPLTHQLEIKDVKFDIRKSVKGQFITKEIDISHNQKKFHYFEKVRIITKEEFINMIHKAGLKVIEIWGDYQLGPYGETNSDRLIIMAQKQK